MFDIHLSLTQQIVLMATLMIASKGMAGVPGVSIVVLLTTLGSMHLPAQGLALIIGIDRLLDMVRTCVNVMGNALSTIVISKWENVYDKEKAKSTLKHYKNLYLTFLANLKTLVLDSLMHLSKDKCKHMKL